MLAALAPCSLSSSVFLEKGEQEGRESESESEKTTMTTRRIILLKRKRDVSQAEIETQHQEKM
jgi:hypothetical protein